KKPCR
ncbi:von Willebrand factor type A domain protein, partial [Vibrio parahaemolyticus V-223/04]